MSRGRRISRVKFQIPETEIAKKYLMEWDPAELHHNPEKYPLISSDSLFGANLSLSLDIGCGTGEFLNAMAKQNPDGNFLGVEISRRAIYHAVHQAAQSDLDNILYIRADFKLLYPLFPENSLEIVYLNFPDPNYGGIKNRKNRIFSPDFLQVMATALNESGRIQVVTDQRPFLLDMLEIASSDKRFQSTHSTPYLTDFSPPAKTRFQLAWEKYQRPVYRFELVRA